jgi:glutathione S-transferase
MFSSPRAQAQGLDVLDSPTAWGRQSEPSEAMEEEGAVGGGDAPEAPSAPPGQAPQALRQVKRPKRSAAATVDYSQKALVKAGVTDYWGKSDRPRKEKEEEPEYVVEKIVDKRVEGKGRSRTTEYRVRWKNYSEEDDTWEPVQGLGKVMGKLAAFEKVWEAKQKAQQKKEKAVVTKKAGKRKKAAASEGPLELLYWSGRGLMEVPRMMLALKGKFPGTDFKDVRATTEEVSGDDDRRVPYASIQDQLGSNLGRMPVMKLPGGAGSIGQSCAINYYLAQELGLFGSSLVEGAAIISIQEHLRELKSSWSSMVPYGKEPEPADVDRYFDTTPESADLSGGADMTKRKDRYLRWYMGRLEGIVGGAGHAVGKKFTLADFLIYNTFAEKLTDAEQPNPALPKCEHAPLLSYLASPGALPPPLGGSPDLFCQLLSGWNAWDHTDQTLTPVSRVLRRAGRSNLFSDNDRMDVVLGAHPKLSKICAAVAAHPNIIKYLGMRGVQKF